MSKRSLALMTNPPSFKESSIGIAELRAIIARANDLLNDKEPRSSGISTTVVTSTYLGIATTTTRWILQKSKFSQPKTKFEAAM
jgi:hypothetical protein